ncbi:unnamed protein product [Chrysodeixis includens]|uniref:Uncharacterized protein n=1 Tax=Chrysodeixis includens TaxID=689277 RepID=A0A9P0BPU2_CHRIL|nr:unnamed protein product [Chrysodeixis includens]
MSPEEVVEEVFKVKRVTYETATPFNAPLRYAEVGEVSVPYECVNELDIVSTKARYTYELDRYSKNAMLIFEGTDNADTTENNFQNGLPHNNDLSSRLKETFEKYRFEVEIHRGLKDHEIASTCDTFFQRDFTEYGCVGIIMLPKVNDGYVESYHTPKSEFGVLPYLSDLYTPTLEGKPIIYIIQTESCYVVPQARVSSRIPQDILEFRIPVPITTPDVKTTIVSCLLEYVNTEIARLGDKTDLYTILKDSVKEFTRSGQHYDVPVGFYSSLTKELWLAHTQE